MAAAAIISLSPAPYAISKALAATHEDKGKKSTHACDAFVWTFFNAYLTQLAQLYPSTLSGIVYDARYRVQHASDTA